MKIHTGDQVEIIAGKDKGKRGKVKQALPAKSKVIVEGLNIVKRHRRQGIRNARQVGIIELEAALDCSNVMIVSPKYNRPRRVGYTFLTDGTKVRMLHGGHDANGLLLEDEQLNDRQ